MTDATVTRPAITKSPTGIPGLDEITNGGLPAGRPTLVSGGPGSGKTLIGITFLVHGAVRFDEPGALITFEENAEELAEDVASLGFDLPALIKQGRLAVDYVHVDRSEIEETGEYDLEGLFVRIEHAVQSIGAKRVVLDTIESLFGGLQNETILRAELRRLFRWLKDRDLTNRSRPGHRDRYRDGPCATYPQPREGDQEARADGPRVGRRCSLRRALRCRR
jgi:circadian clock protein KaiC